MPKKPSLTEIAARIAQHLDRFEHDPKINRPHRVSKTHPYYGSHAYRGGCRVMVIYITYQGPNSLTRDEAERYLAWLNAGNIGQHWKAFRDRGEP